MRSCEKEAEIVSNTCNTECAQYEGYRIQVCEKICYEQAQKKDLIKTTCTQTCKKEPSNTRYVCEKDCIESEHTRLEIENRCTKKCGDQKDCFNECKVAEEKIYVCEQECFFLEGRSKTICVQTCMEPK